MHSFPNGQAFANEHSFEDENLGSIVVEAKHKEGTLAHPVSTLFDAYKLRDMPIMKEYDEVDIVITRGDGNTEIITSDSPNIFNN